MASKLASFRGAEASAIRTLIGAGRFRGMTGGQVTAVACIPPVVSAPSGTLGALYLYTSKADEEVNKTKCSTVRGTSYVIHNMDCNLE